MTTTDTEPMYKYVAEEYDHFTRICGVPTTRAKELLAEAFGVTQGTIGKYLHRTNQGHR